MKGASKVDEVLEAFNVMIEDWNMMQQTSGDVGAEWAERFEKHFYEFSKQLKDWINLLQPRPMTLEEIENLPEMKKMLEILPEPLHLNLIIELEEIIEDIETHRYD